MAPRYDEGEDLAPATPDTTRRDRRFSGDQDEARQAALEKELQGIRSINQVVEGVIGTLEKAKENMETVSRTVDNASTLLNTWTRILSQTEHNQRLILNPEWKGATQDLTDIETEAIEKRQAAQRRAAEEERRRAEAQRKQEEEERQQQAAASTRGARGTRSRSRGYTRGASSAAASSTSSTSAKGGTGVGRGTRGAGGSRYGRIRGTTR